jgi:hypothetical protein
VFCLQKLQGCKREKKVKTKIELKGNRKTSVVALLIFDIYITNLKNKDRIEKESVYSCSILHYRIANLIKTMNPCAVKVAFAIYVCPLHVHELIHILYENYRPLISLLVFQLVSKILRTVRSFLNFECSYFMIGLKLT